MAYHSINILRKAIEIQQIVLSRKKEGVTQKWIYENLIRDQYFISPSTFNRYLGMNAKKRLKDLEQAKNTSPQ